MGGGGGTSQDFRATGQLSTIAREQYNRIHAMTDPVARQLVASTNAATLPQAMKWADSAVANSFDTQRSALARDMQRQGVQMTPELDQEVQRQSALDRAAATATLENTARRRVRERDMDIMSGGINSTLTIPKIGG